MAAAGQHLLFVSKPTGYELLEREGDAPEPGAELELDGTRWRVSNNGLSRPLPLPPWLAEAFDGRLRKAPTEGGPT